MSPHLRKILMTNLPCPTTGQLFRHLDGGYYRFLMRVRHSEDQAPHLVYEHLWPFDTDGDAWVRPADEWPSRFTPVTEDELEAARRGDRDAARQAVTAAKAARRAAVR